MIPDLFVRLGSGQTSTYGVGSKGALLDQAAYAGVRVPRSVLVLDAAWDLAILEGLLVMNGDLVRVPDPALLMRFLQLPEFEGRVAVRSAFNIEDEEESSLAGYFETVLDVDASNPVDMANAIRSVLKSGAKYEEECRWDILIMEMVDAECAGVAFTEREYEDDLINYTDGTAEKLLAGEIEGETLSLAKLRSWEDSPHREDLTPWQIRLQRLLRDVRRWMGVDDWDVEWADDGQHCYLIQLRPITRPTRRNERFTVANHREILPDLPSTFMTSVIESCADDLYGYYRQFDGNLPSGRPFIEVFCGRPYINLSLLTETMRILGLPTRMVTQNIGGLAGRGYGFNLGRFINKTSKLILPRMALAQMCSVRSVRRATGEVLQRTENPGETFAELVATLRWLYTTHVTQRSGLTAAIAPVMLILRRLRVVEEHSAQQETVATRMYSDLEPLRQFAAKNAHALDELERGEIPEEEQFRSLWGDYLDKYGHRGIYECDIARPRYHEAPEPLLQSLVSPPGRRPLPPERTFRGRLTLPIWWYASRIIHAREQWRHDVMRGFDRIRQALLKLAERVVERGALPAVDALWMLTIDEARKLDDGWKPGQDFFEARDDEIERYKSYHLPDVFCRFDDLERYREGEKSVEEADYLTGISLTTGDVEGRAWVLTEPQVDLPASFETEDTILVARSVDSGWIATFSRVSGVVVEIGSDLSHGSIILREIGLPAITNVRDATQHFKTGDAVMLRAGAGVVERM